MYISEGLSKRPCFAELESLWLGSTFLPLRSSLVDICHRVIDLKKKEFKLVFKNIFYFSESNMSVGSLLDVLVLKEVL